MGSKTKKRNKRNSPANLFQQAQRNLEKGSYKQALKDARACFRQAASDEHRRLLEFAHIARAEGLIRAGNRDACREIVESLLELGVTEESVEAVLPDVLVAIGMLDRLPSAKGAVSDQQQAELRIKAADHAVLRPNEAPAAMPEIRDGGRQVHDALDLLHDGDEAGAFTKLKDIARESPLADWRFFVRGLAAYYRQDTSKMSANWERLDPDRFAARIARPLRVMAGAVPLDLSDSPLRASIAKLERGVTSRSLLPELSVLQRQVGEEEWIKVLQTLRSVRGRLREVDPRLYERLAGWLRSQFIGMGAVQMIDRLARVVDPPAIDPYWNRARALAAEADQYGDPQEEISYWRKYLLDLRKAPGFSAEERNFAEALVQLRLAQEHARKARSLRNCPCGRSHEKEIREAIHSGENCFNRCLELAPTRAAAYEQYADLHEAAGDRERAADVYRRGLERLPDNSDFLLYLTQHELQNDAPIAAQEFAQRARRTKPLDRGVAQMLWATHVGAAREYARQSKFDEARGEFDAADQVLPDRHNDYDVLARKAVLEIKAGNAEASRQFIEQALETLEEPTPLWLYLTIEATRYELPKEESWLYEKRWTDALKRKCNGSTAGLMCKILRAHSALQTEYRAGEDHVAKLLKYVRRCSRVKWKEEDLRNVCEFLREMDEDHMLDKFARKGQRKFPRTAYFHWAAGDREFQRGPGGNRIAARVNIERAIELASQSNDSRDQMFLEEAKQKLTFLQEMEDAPFGGFWDDDDVDEAEESDSGSESIGPDYAFFEAMCRRLGFDPEEIFKNVAEDEGVPVPPGPAKQATKRSKK